MVAPARGLRDVPTPRPRPRGPWRGRAAGRRRPQGGGFSKGMRQRVKLAQALAHDPEVLLLDEPLNGLDPVQRRARGRADPAPRQEGRTVLVSSHVLHEVERMAPRVVVLVNGKLVAEGDTAGIRALIRDRPRSVRIETEGGRAGSRASSWTRGWASAAVRQRRARGRDRRRRPLGRRLMPLACDARRDAGAHRAARRRPRERLRLSHRSARGRGRCGERPVSASRCGADLRAAARCCSRCCPGRRRAGRSLFPAARESAERRHSRAHASRSSCR